MRQLTPKADLRTHRGKTLKALARCSARPLCGGEAGATDPQGSRQGCRLLFAKAGCPVEKPAPASPPRRGPAQSWALALHYDGAVFRSVWQDYRGNTANDEDALRVVTQASFSVPHRPGERRVCVRAVDVFGFEAEVVQAVAENAT